MILLRHGQSEFNLHYTATRTDPGIPDPRLTPLGHQQAQAAAEALAKEDVRRILASPYTRALQTAAPLAEKLGLPVLITPLVRERYALSCDVGSPCSRLSTDWPHHDFTRIDEVWWPQEEEPPEAVAARAMQFRLDMMLRDDWAHTVVVSHWGFILAMTGRSLVNGEWLRCDPTGPEPENGVWHHG